MYPASVNTQSSPVSGAVFDVAHRSQNRHRVGDDRAARFHHDLQVIQQVFGARLARRSPHSVDRGLYHLRRRKLRSEHCAFVRADLFGVRVVAQVVHRNAAADVDVLQLVPGFAVQPQQVFPHRGEGFDIGFGIGRLRPDVDVNAGQIDKLRRTQCAQHHLARVGRRNAELRRVHRRLQSGVRSRADARDQSHGHVGAALQLCRDLFDQF